MLIGWKWRFRTLTQNIFTQLYSLFLARRLVSGHIPFISYVKTIISFIFTLLYQWLVNQIFYFWIENHSKSFPKGDLKNRSNIFEPDNHLLERTSFCLGLTIQLRVQHLLTRPKPLPLHPVYLPLSTEFTDSVQPWY